MPRDHSKDDTYHVRKPKRKIAENRIVMANGAFAKWIAKRYGVSAPAVNKALQLLRDGITEALLEGYAIQINQLGVFETREQAPRRYWSRQNQCFFISKPATHVHFKKSPTLTKRIRYESEAKLAAMLAEPTVKPVNK